MEIDLKNIDLFTDGAARGNPGPGGYGALLLFEDESGQLHRRELSAGFDLTTNNRMELMGVIAGLEALNQACRVTVHTDSEYVANAFNKNWIEGWVKRGWKNSQKKPVKNDDLWRRLLAAIEPHEVAFEWVKGHAGHPENELCDELATSAADGDGRHTDEGYIRSLQ